MSAFKASYWAVSPRYLLVFQMLAADRRAMYDFPQITKITLIGERYETVTHCTAAQTGKGVIPGRGLYRTYIVTYQCQCNAWAMLHQRPQRCGHVFTEWLLIVFIVLCWAGLRPLPRVTFLAPECRVRSALTSVRHPQHYLLSHTPSYC